MSNIYFMLGVPLETSMREMKKAYGLFMEKLVHEKQSRDDTRLGHAIELLSQSYEHLKLVEPPEPCSRQDCHDATCPQHSVCHPKLGQLLVSSGVLTLQDLEIVLEIQSSLEEHVRLGELLVRANYLTRDELEYYLELQRVIELPTDHTDQWGQRLIALGLISEDELKVALIRQNMEGCTLRQAIIDCGFLIPEDLDKIF